MDDEKDEKIIEAFEAVNLLFWERKLTIEEALRVGARILLLGSADGDVSPERFKEYMDALCRDYEDLIASKDNP